MAAKRDELWDEWKPGNLIVWDPGLGDMGPNDSPFVLLEIDEYERVFWREDAKECMTRATNMQRLSIGVEIGGNDDTLA